MTDDYRNTKFTFKFNSGYYTKPPEPVEEKPAPQVDQAELDAYFKRLKEEELAKTAKAKADLERFLKGPVSRTAPKLVKPERKAGVQPSKPKLRLSVAALQEDLTFIEKEIDRHVKVVDEANDRYWRVKQRQEDGYEVKLKRIMAEISKGNEEIRNLEGMWYENQWEIISVNYWRTKKNCYKRIRPVVGGVMEYQKVQSVAKNIVIKSKKLDDAVLTTMKTISSIVGATLGPGGRQVLIERQEHGLPPMVTKDGVTVFRSLGFDDPSAQSIMESARDASVRTASEAGDGTTTATILAEAIVRLTKKYSQENPRVSPQKVVRRLETAFRTIVEPAVRSQSVKANLATPEGREMLRSVAKLSANGDGELADAVIKCFDIVGDNGNVTIAETSGPSRYEVERIEGYPIQMGYEECAGKFYNKFVNDIGNSRVLLEKAKFVLYHGRIQDPQSLFILLSRMGLAFEQGQMGPNVVLVATGFSESVIGYLSMMFAADGALNVFPLLVPQSPFPNGQFDFLADLAAVTGATILDPMNLPFEQALLEHFGSSEVFESYRFRSNVVGKPNEDLLLLRVDELNTNLTRAESQLDSMYLQERIGKLTGGIARLKIIGVSNGELKEKRDRAEDAVCAVRGAIKQGCLPGGGWMLLKLRAVLEQQNDEILNKVLAPALFEPFRRLLENVGVTEDHNAEEFHSILSPIEANVRAKPNLHFPEIDPMVYDALEGKHVDPFQGGILDSTPAVLEAIRNSIGIAALLGTLGGVVVFKRNAQVEAKEAQQMSDFTRSSADSLINEADLRG